MFRKVLLLLALLPLCAKAVDVKSDAGNLSSVLGDDKEITRLSVEGTMDARDFKFIFDELSHLASLDLSKVEIVGYDSDEALFGQNLSYAAAKLPDYSFFGSKLNSITLPENLKEIGAGAFCGSSIAQIKVPQGVTAIGDFAFCDCDELVDAVMPASVVKIGKSSFAKCDKLEKVSLSGAVEELQPETFAYCTALGQVSLPQSVEKIGGSAFSGCASLKNIDFPKSLSGIGDNAFYGSGLNGADLSQNAALTTVGAWAFANCQALTSVKLSSNVAEIGAGAFAFNSLLSEVALPTSLEKVSDYMFMRSSSVMPHQIPAAVGAIGKYAFAEWNRTASFYFPDDTKSIGDYAFENWTSVKTFTAKLFDVPALGENVFFGIDQANVTLYVPDESMKAAFEAAEQWNKFNVASLHGTSVDALDDDGDVRVAFDNSVLRVKTSFEVSESVLFDVSGALLVKTAPKSDAFAIDTDGFSSKFYILLLKDNAGECRMVKLARK